MLKTLKNRSYLLVIVLMSIIIFKQLPFINNKIVKVALASEGVQISEYTDGVGYDISWNDQIENLKDGVSYIVESSDTKVVEVVKKKAFNKLYYVPYTRAIGTATLTVYEPVKNGKNKKIGQIKVTVVPTQIKQKEIKVKIHGGNFSILAYENINGAKFSYKISNPQIVHRQEYDEFIAIKPGTTYITVTENYKGKNTVIGKVKWWRLQRTFLKKI